MIKFSFWINSKDSLPKKGEQVLVYHTVHDYINIEYFAGNKRYLNGMKTENTYWMPLPEKPKLIKN